MDTNQKRTLAIVGVVGVGALALWYLAQQSSGSPVGVSTPTLAQAAPGLGGGNYQPSTFNVPPLSLTLPSGGAGSTFDFVGPTTTITGPTFNSSNGGAPGSMDGVSPPCQCDSGCASSTGTPNAFGSQLDQALALAPFTAAVDASVVPLLTSNLPGSYGDLNDMRAALAHMQDTAAQLLQSSIVAFNPGF